MAAALKPKWKGNLAIGLVNVPVHLYATADKKSQAPTGHHVHKGWLDKDTGEQHECRTQTELKKWCPKCDRAVPGDELMKGYDVPGGFVELTDDEIAGLKVASQKTIQITQVAKATELEPLMIADTSYLVGDGSAAAAEAEAILIEALRGKVGVGTLVMSGRERTVAIVVVAGGFLLHVLRTAEQMKSFPLRGASLPTPNPKMVELASRLVAAMEVPFLDLSETRDAYADGMKALVAAKAGGAVLPTTEAPVAASAPSLMDALMASLSVASPHTVDVPVVPKVVIEAAVTLKSEGAPKRKGKAK